MRYLILSILAILLALPASAAELLIIQSHSNQLFDQTVKMIQNSCAKKNQTYIMSDYAEFDLGRIVREEQPRLVIAVGDKPLKESLKLRNTPVLYTMALAAQENLHRDNISGVSMHSAAEYYFKLLNKLKLHSAGIVYSSAKNGNYIERARKIAHEYNIKLVTMPVNSPKDVDQALSRLASSGVESIWMIPDTTAVTTETLDSYFLTAQNANIPVISFSKAYLEKGALAAVEASRKKMTELLCGKVRQILNGGDPADTPVTDISEASLYTNEVVASRLGISLSGTAQLFQSVRK